MNTRAHNIRPKRRTSDKHGAADEIAIGILLALLLVPGWGLLILQIMRYSCK